MKAKEIIFSPGKVFCGATNGKLWVCESIVKKNFHTPQPVVEIIFKRFIPTRIERLKRQFNPQNLTSEQRNFIQTNTVGDRGIAGEFSIKAAKITTDEFIPVREKSIVKTGDKVVIINEEDAKERTKAFNPGVGIRQSESPFKLKGLTPGTIAKAIRWHKEPLGGRPVIMTKFANPYVYEGKKRIWNTDNYWLHKDGMVPIDINNYDWADIEVCSTTEQLLKELENEELGSIANDTEFIPKKSIKTRYSSEKIQERHFEKIKVERKVPELQINEDETLLLLV